jgi:hypothetical protein
MRTGFEVDKDFVPERDMLVAGRFQVEEFLGEAAFSTAIQCKDLASENEKEPDVSSPLYLAYVYPSLSVHVIYQC